MVREFLERRCELCCVAWSAVGPRGPWSANSSSAGTNYDAFGASSNGARGPRGPRSAKSLGAAAKFGLRASSTDCRLVVRVVRRIHELRRSIIIVIITIIIIYLIAILAVFIDAIIGARSISMCSDAALRSMVALKRAPVGSCAGQCSGARGTQDMGSFRIMRGSPRRENISGAGAPVDACTGQ